VSGQLIAVLREALDGPPERWSYFTDNRSDAGLFGTLARWAWRRPRAPWPGRRWPLTCPRDVGHGRNVYSKTLSEAPLTAARW